MTERSYRGFLWSLVLIGFLVDQGTKYGVFQWLYPVDAQARRGEFEVLPGAFKLVAEYTEDAETGSGFLAGLRTWSGVRLPHKNSGALFGLGPQEFRKFIPGLSEDAARKLANRIFTTVSILAAVAILIWSLRRATARDFPLCAALGLILAGTLGNLYDRVVFEGVRDFLYFYWIEWPVFNVADCCLVCGAGLLFVQAFVSRPAEDKPPAAALSRQVAEVN